MNESIKCPHCGRVSYNPNDVRERYCGFCHCYHDQFLTETFEGRIGRFIIRRIERQLRQLAVANNVNLEMERHGGTTQIGVTIAVCGSPWNVEAFMNVARERWET